MKKRAHKAKRTRTPRPDVNQIAKSIIDRIAERTERPTFPSRPPHPQRSR